MGSVREQTGTCTGSTFGTKNEAGLIRMIWKWATELIRETILFNGPREKLKPPNDSWMVSSDVAFTIFLLNNAAANGRC